MTVSATFSSQTFLGNGATTVFAFGFIAVSANYIVVTYVDASGNTTVLPASAYSLSLNSATGGALWGIGGTVTYLPSTGPIASGTSLTVTRVLPLVQQTSISTQANLYLSAFEQALDILTMALQQVAAGADLALQVPIEDISPQTILPAAAARAGKYLAFDSSGNVIAATPSGVGVPISAAMQSIVAAATPAAALGLLGGPAVIATIASLRMATATTLAQGECYVLGYALAADGGEGPFVSVASDTTSTDNGGTIIVDAAGRRWHRSTGGQVLSAKWFGAKGNGVTDDTAALQAAITASAGGRLRIPAGTYITSTPLALNNGTSYWIEGDGYPVDGVSAGTIISSANATGGDVITISDVGGGSSLIRISGMMLQGNRWGGNGLTATNCHRLICEDVQAWNCGGHGFHLVSCFVTKFMRSTALQNALHGFWFNSVANAIAMRDCCALGNARVPGGYSNVRVDGVTGTSLCVDIEGLDCEGAGANPYSGVTVDSASGMVIVGTAAFNLRSSYFEQGSSLATASAIFYSDATVVGMVLDGNYFQDGPVNISGSVNARISYNYFNKQLAATALNITSPQGSNINLAGNAFVNGATILRGPTNQRLEEYSSAVPTAGNHSVGDICWFTAPAAGAYIGWVCVTAGTPGAWQPFGAIA